jgi:type IV pilus assembly protein PilB
MFPEYKIEDLKNKLVADNIITAEKFDELLSRSEAEKQSIENILLSKNILSTKKLTQIISKLRGCPYVELSNLTIEPQVIEIIPEIVSRNQKIIAFEQDGERLKVAMADPNNLEIINLLKKKTNMDIVVYCASKDEIDKAIKKYSKGILGKLKDLTTKKVIQGSKRVEDISIIRIIDIILRYAYENKASDIHIEPYKQKTVIRYRIDGILHDIAALPKELHSLVVSRIKILSNLRTDEHRSAQDGKFQFQISNENIDVRVSIVPVVKGEKLVLRILSKQNIALSLTGIGLSDHDLEIVKRNIKRPHGMILVTGPTGCGKTTTLYAILKLLNKKEINISTIEDPVEYDIEGVNQIQVNTKTNLTFANGLRSILRQDPNIIMVGEIRDEETANIAINAALTGHLVLSTLHTNDAATTLSRFIDMKIEPFLVASTVNLIIAQRLVRRVCESDNLVSHKEIKIKNLVDVIGEDLVKKYFPNKDTYQLTYGNATCGQSGYSGRVGIFEVLEVDESIKELIIKRVPASQIQAQAVKNGMTTMLEDGLRKVVSGITTIEEVVKTTELEIEK